LKNILITGGAGFIGSNLSLQLIAKGYSITIVDILHEQIHGREPLKSSPLFLSIQDKVRFIQYDISDSNPAFWTEILKNQHILVHFAAETGTGQSMYQLNRYNQTNVMGTSNLLEALQNQKHQIEKVVVASSRAVYGEGKYFSKLLQQFVYPKQRTEQDMLKGDFECKCPITNGELELCATSEDSFIQPNSIYGLNKYEQEKSIEIICTALNIPFVAFRYQNVYGVGQSLSNPYTGILAVFSNRIRANQPILIFEDGKESRDFVYIDDVVEATILGIENAAANNLIFNVGTGIATTVLDVANHLRKNFEVEVPIELTGKFRKGDIRHNFADIRLIQEKLGFMPKIPFEVGINKYVDWVKTQENPENNYEKSLEEMQAKGLYK
jgi:dTDP-L-rhamnose 4-epimerase